MSDDAEERLEAAFLILVKLAQKTDERSDKIRWKELNAKMNALADAQIRTAESIKNLMAKVDRYFNEGRNGRS